MTTIPDLHPFYRWCSSWSWWMSIVGGHIDHAVWTNAAWSTRWAVAGGFVEQNELILFHCRLACQLELFISRGCKVKERVVVVVMVDDHNQQHGKLRINKMVSLCLLPQFELSHWTIGWWRHRMTMILHFIYLTGKRRKLTGLVKRECIYLLWSSSSSYSCCSMPPVLIKVVLYPRVVRKH